MKTSYQSPVYKIRRGPLDQIRSNAYNPNSVAPPEMKLLYQSIKEDGYTMPIVCYKLEDGTYEIVDGFHRCQIMKTYRDIYEREGGLMPVGMDAEELLRLKQLSGIASLFRDEEFSRAWESK